MSVQEIRKGSCFGELFVFSPIPSRATVISATYAILCKLSRFHCERVLEGYPDCAGVIAGHVNYMLRKANSSKDNNASEASSSTSSTPAGSSRALKSRRSSRASRVITETSNLVKALSRRSSVSEEELHQPDRARYPSAERSTHVHRVLLARDHHGTDAIIDE